MTITASDLQELKDQLGERFITDQRTFAPYMRDMSWMLPEGEPIGAVFAESTEDVSKALAWANKHIVPVSVRTGGSGLAGGSVSYDGGLILSLHKMNRILEIDPENGVAVIEPGIINAEFNKELAKEGFFFAPDPASASIASVGGNIATNAGGLRAVCHGVTINWVRALEVVLADGRVIEVGSKTIKNVSSLNLKELFIGSEGTLGVITQAVVRIEHIPEYEPYTFFACFDSIEDAGYATIAIRAAENKPVSLELIDALGVRLVNERNPDLQIPQPGAGLLLGQAEGQSAKEDVEEFANTCREYGATAVMFEEGNRLFQVRRDAYPALSAAGMEVIGDVSVPIASLAEAIHNIMAISEKRQRRVSILAHAGDGNIHPIVECGEGIEESRAAEELLDEVCEMAVGMGGVVSGEHGIGYLKHHAVTQLLSPDTREVQLAIKKALDPNGILTPGRKL
ncbi:MAG: FAD-binding protein [Actinomycetaceae bacterium]|nr:FAD-binding protein [Actinomycetaceae bacterium]